MVAIGVWLPSWESIETHILRGKPNACQQATITTSCSTDLYMPCLKASSNKLQQHAHHALAVMDDIWVVSEQFCHAHTVAVPQAIANMFETVWGVICTYKAIPALVDHLHLIVIKADIKWNWVISTHTCSIFIFVPWTCHDDHTNVVKH